MEERPISSRMQELLQRATDERQAEQHRQGESVESLRARVDELSTSVVAGNERLAEKIDATFALTASTVDILQRLADRVDALERSLDDITMRVGSISWRMDEVRDGEGRLADRIDESALALAEAMFASRGGRPDRDERPDVNASDGFDATRSDAARFDAPGSEAPRSDAEAPSDRGEFGAPVLDGTDHDLPAADTDLSARSDTGKDAGTDTGFDASTDSGPYSPEPEPPRDDDPFRVASDDDERRPSYRAAESETSAHRDDVADPRPPSAPEPDDRPLADVLDLPSSGREPMPAQRSGDSPGDEVASGRPSWGPSGDFLGSRPAAVGAAQAAGSETVVFEFPTESTGPSAEQVETASQIGDPQQDFFDRWAPQAEESTAPDRASHLDRATNPGIATNTAPALTPDEASTPDENRNPVRGLGGPRTGQRFLREVSAARENQDVTRPTEASYDSAAVPETRATDDTVPPEWFASYFRNEARSAGSKPVPKNGPSPAPLPGGRPAPGSA